jgi:hypothetical protein
MKTGGVGGCRNNTGQPITKLISYPVKTIISTDVAAKSRF